MEKDTLTKYRMQVFNAIYPIIKGYVDNDKDRATAATKSISAECSTVIERAWGEAEGQVEKQIATENGDACIQALDKEKIIAKIVARISTPGLSKEQELKYIAELNKLQDNYNETEDNEYVIERVQYPCPVCDGARKSKERKATASKFH